MIGRVVTLTSALALGSLAGLPVAAQYQIGSGIDYLGYSFDDGLGAETAELYMIPVALRIPVNERLSFDLFSAWADGQVEVGGQSQSLSGVIDTSVKASFQAAPWAVIGLSANLPTGDGTHTSEEAIVASVLSTDMLGFREATWGTGFALTSSVGVARQVGDFGVGVAAAYAVRSEFEPAEGANLMYQPGNETRIRLGIDRNFGNSTLTLGGTFVNYANDQISDNLGDRNLFQAGNRIRIDASYAFRAGAGVWTIYAADLIRENGDRNLDVIDETNTLVGTEQVETASQNLFIGGFVGTLGLGGGFVFRPHVDVKVQSRDEPDGSDAGSGWMLSTGGDLPLRLVGTEFFPKARVSFGSIRSVTGEDVTLVGFEFKGTVRVGF